MIWFGANLTCYPIKPILLYGSDIWGMFIPFFSKRYQYNNMPLIMLKYKGNLPSSDNTAMLVVLLCTPRMNLQNFKCINDLIWGQFDLLPY
jgi:hypothetical protein